MTQTPLQFLGIILLSLVFFFFFVLPVIGRPLFNLILFLVFDLKRKRKVKLFLKKSKKLLKFFLYPRFVAIKGKVIDLKVEKFVIPYSELNNENSDFITRAMRPPILCTVFCLVIQNLKNNRESLIEIPKEKFAELNERRSFYLNKNISLYFKRYFWNDNFDHLVI